MLYRLAAMLSPETPRETPSETRRETGREPPQISVVIAVLNEEDNVAAVTKEIVEALMPFSSFEIVYVDDGSTDATVTRIRALNLPHVRVVRHAQRCGKSQAVRTGVAAARGRWIGTMDGDGQDDPLEVVRMAQKAFAHAAQTGGSSAIVAGVRKRREDPWHRKVATKVGNGVRQAILNDGCPDSACGLKFFEREAYLLLPVFEGQHRFLPALFKSYGHPLILHEVHHRPRAAGVSKYTNFGRALVGVMDLAGVVWLRARTRAPKVLQEH